MSELSGSTLAPLPLVLWKTPPGLELILAQEGVPFEIVREAHAFAFRAGRFVLYDGRSESAAALRGLLTHEHVAIDVDGLRHGEPVDPFEALVDDREARATWDVRGCKLRERVARRPKAWIRRRLIAALRDAVAATAESGCGWRRSLIRSGRRSTCGSTSTSRFPRIITASAWPATSSADCCTHFVSTNAYATSPRC